MQKSLSEAGSDAAPGAAGEQVRSFSPLLAGEGLGGYGPSRVVTDETDDMGDRSGIAWSGGPTDAVEDDLRHGRADAVQRGG